MPKKTLSEIDIESLKQLREALDVLFPEVRVEDVDAVKQLADEDGRELAFQVGARSVVSHVDKAIKANESRHRRNGGS